jgi:hypothetical protein
MQPPFGCKQPADFNTQIEAGNDGPDFGCLIYKPPHLTSDVAHGRGCCCCCKQLQQHHQQAVFRKKGRTQTALMSHNCSVSVIGRPPPCFNFELGLSSFLKFWSGQKFTKYRWHLRDLGNEEDFLG